MDPVERCRDLHPLPIGWTRAVYAKDTPYRPLPVLIGETCDRPVVSCWQLTWRERLYVLWTGQFYLTQLTFGDSLQSQLPEVARRPW